MIAGIIIVFLPLWYVINYHNVKEENIDQYTLSRKYKIENKKFDYDKGGYMPKEQLKILNV